MHPLYGALQVAGTSGQGNGHDRSLNRLASLSSSISGGATLARSARIRQYFNDPLLLASPRSPTELGDGRYALALDGWLANRDELTRALGNKLGQGGTDDAGLIAAALLCWGDAALDRLHGQFALAWWDGRERRLLLACDRTGGRSLFYHQGGEGYRLRFASTVDILLADPAIPRTVDPVALTRDVMILEIAGGRTCFAGIDVLPAAHKLIATSAGCRLERYWQPDYHRRVRFRRDSEYVEATRDLLDQVVGEHMPSSGPVVATMSTGLDSSAVAATAARLAAPDPIYAITLRPAPGVPLPTRHHVIQDEWPLARTIADLHPNMQSLGVESGADAIEDLQRSAMPLIGRPLPHLLAMSWFDPIWGRARQLGAKAVLGGRSGNLSLSASAMSEFFRPAILADMGPALADALMKLRYDHSLESVWRALKGMAPFQLLSRYRQLAGKPPSWCLRSAVTTTAAEALNVEQVWRAGGLEDVTNVPFRLRWRMRAQEQTWRRSVLFSPLQYRHGVEHRDPLGDIRLVEFCLALPFDQFTRGREDRWLARRVLADRLPAALLAEKRRGFQCAEWYSLMTPLRPWMAEHLDRLHRSSLGRELVDIPRLRASLADWPTDADAAAPRHVELAQTLGRAVNIGIFLRWAEGGND
jgi:asparagine synthase (glutamine-hydrolysing)